ncbi:MAG: serine/threonine-protein kinase [Kofleriaceae bacterium]
MDLHHGPPQQDLLIGQTIGNYLVKQKLGEGGMGSVYLAEHPSIGKKVALKVLHSEFSTNQDIAARFFNEAKAVNDIGHPNIVDIVDFGIIQAGANRDQLVYFIMEYLSGVTLSALIRNESPVPPERALGIGLQVADALAASHKCGIVHRDLKPDNIILQPRGRERDFVKLLDFGIAKLTNDAQGSRRTRTGIVMGTPAYMSPEQCEGRGNIDHRTDIYALGILLYEMLTGRVPFIGEGYGEILVQHLTQPPIPPSQFRMMNMHIEAVVMKALEKRPEMRYPSMDEMMRAMSDPVGYVESYGGIQSFMQRQLMPSSAANAPGPTIRLTPAPMTTPVPGSINYRGNMQTGPGGMMTPYPHTANNMGVTPSPTTLGASSGELTGKRSKVGFVIAGVVVAAAAVIGVVMMSKGKDPNPIASPPAAIDAAVAAELPPATPDAAGPAVAPGSAAGSAKIIGDGSAVGSDAGSNAGFDAGSGKLTIETAKISITSVPPGAKILIDGKEHKQRTPAELVLPVGARPVKIVLRLRDHEDLALKPIVVNEDQKLLDIKLKKRAGPVPGKGSGRGSGKGKGTDEDGLERPE